jgi:putative transcriptional regulator
MSTEPLSLDDLLMAHAAGKLAEPVALVVATHLALSPTSRLRYRRYLALGGSLLEGIEPVPLDKGAWERLAARLDELSPTTEEAAHPKLPGDPGCGLPQPLRDYLPRSLDELRWRHYGPIFETDLVLGSHGYRTRLIRLRAGRAVPRHTHDGSELTLVLEGAFHDGFGHYRRGDLAIADAAIDHQPVADGDRDCLCLTVTDAPLRLTGPIGRFLNPFLRI